jgi:PAS domain S-box-containing protein
MQPQNLVLILARELADKLASAVFLVDDEGKLLYFNERAEQILGETFAEIGRMRLEDWAAAWKPTDSAGSSLRPEELPLAIALQERRPAHRTFGIHSRDGTPRTIAVTAFPLLAHEDEFVGAAAIFWEHDETGEGGR